jgi:hypothetical protein
MISESSARNFKILQWAMTTNEEEPNHKNGVALVECQADKGRTFQVLCVVHDSDEGTFYTPYALMLTGSLFPLMNKLRPPENLRGAWVWHPAGASV